MLVGSTCTEFQDGCYCGEGDPPRMAEDSSSIASYKRRWRGAEDCGVSNADGKDWDSRDRGRWDKVVKKGKGKS